MATKNVKKVKVKSVIKKSVKAKKKVTKSKTTVKPIAQETNDLTQEQKIENSKYYLGGEFKQPFDEKQFVLPESYGQDKLVLLVRDPYWLYTYWDLSGGKVEELKSQFGSEVVDSSKMVLRVKDISDRNPDNPNSYYDIDVAYGATTWYVNVQDPDKNYCVELGFITPEGRYIFIIRSNTVIPPRDTVSDRFDQQWMNIEDYDRIYALSGGLQIGLSSGELRRKMQEKLESMISSGAVPSSHLVAGKKDQNKNFFLVVNTELVVYGATMPDAKLTIQGQPKEVNPDGTFSVRFALPDGLQNIPVTAVSNDEVDEITITPVVDKKTV